MKFHEGGESLGNVRNVEEKPAHAGTKKKLSMSPLRHVPYKL